MTAFSENSSEMEIDYLNISNSSKHNSIHEVKYKGPVNILWGVGTGAKSDRTFLLFLDKIIVELKLFQPDQQ